MQLSYETQGTNTYLVYTVPQDAELDMISLGMLANNHIPGLAKTIFSQIDSTKYIKYNVSSKVPSEQMFISPISKRRFIGVLNGIINAALSAEEYMLESDALLFDLSYMFSDVMTGETVLICVPTDEQRESPTDLKDFIKRIMYNTSFDQNENCDYIAKIINYINSSALLVLPDFQEFLRSLAKEQVESQNRQPVSQPQPQPQPRLMNVETPERAIPHSQVNTGQINPVSPAVSQVHQVAQKTGPSPQHAGQSVDAPSTQDDSAVKSATGEPGSKQMSLMYLLRHYSKENAAVYKAQQEQAKDANNTASPRSEAKKVDKKAAKREEKKAAKRGNISSPAAEFMVPGMSNGSPATSPSPTPAAVTSGSQTPIRQAAPTPAQYTPVSPLPLQQSPMSQAFFAVSEDFSSDLGGDETVILGAGGAHQAVMPYLVRKKNNERIPLDKDFFRLGRDVDFNDYAIIDNRYVGHSHCHLIQQDGEFFVVDDNSKNHTSVNGKVIAPGQLIKLSHGYVISVADEEFEFKLY